MRVYEPHIHIVNCDHIVVITWLGTHIIVHGSKRGNFSRSTFKLKIQLFVCTKNLAKQLVFVVKGIFKLNDSQRKMLSYCSLEDVDKEDNANSKVDETVVLVGLASSC
jgi:hypothetical protein